VRLGSIFLANSAEIVNGLIYLMGGGWDTANVPPGAPIAYNGSLVVRVLADRAECGRAHLVEIRLEGEDGQLVFRVQSEFTPVIPEGFPVAWEVPFSLVVGVGGPLPRYGLYRFVVLVDGILLGTTPMRATEAHIPGGPQLLLPQPPGA
jgi:hypothetical protein